MRSSSLLLAVALSATAMGVALGAGEQPETPGPETPGPETTCKPQPDCLLPNTGQQPGAANGLQNLRPESGDRPQSNEGRSRSPSAPSSS